MKKYIIAILVFIILAACNQEKKVLIFKLDEGEIYPMTQKTSITVEGLMKSVMEANYDYEVLEIVNDSSYKIKLHFNKIKLEMKTASDHFSIDSESPLEKPDPMAKLLLGLAGKSFTFKMTNMGEMYQVEGLKDIYDEIYETTQMDNKQLSQMTQIIDQFFNESAFKGNLAMLTSMFTKEPISKGSKWQSVDSFESIYSNTLMTNNWKCKKITNGNIYIEGESEMVRLDTETQSPLLSFKELSGVFSSQIILDEKTCWPVKSVFNQELIAKLDMGEPHEEGDHGHEHNPPFEMKTNIKTIITSN